MKRYTATDMGMVEDERGTWMRVADRDNDSLIDSRLLEQNQRLVQTIAMMQMEIEKLQRDNEALTAEVQRLLPQWRPIETAPKGYPALEEPSEWFFARGEKYSGPKGVNIAVIRRSFGNGFGPWQGTGDEQYRADFFTEWMPLPDAPSK